MKLISESSPRTGTDSANEFLAQMPSAIRISRILVDEDDTARKQMTGNTKRSAVQHTRCVLLRHQIQTPRTFLSDLIEPKTVIDPLPDRALTNDEAEQLKQQDSRFVPLSILKGGDDPFVIYTMAFYRNETGRIHLLGYSEEENGWVQFESFSDDEWTVERQENRVQEWVEDHYGDEFEQGMLNEESGTVDFS